MLFLVTTESLRRQIAKYIKLSQKKFRKCYLFVLNKELEYIFLVLKLAFKSF